MTTVQDRVRPETPDEAHPLLATATELVPLLRERAEAGERERRLAEDVVDALRGAGMFRLTAPRRCGGHEVDMRTYLDVCAEISRGDGSAGWVRC